MLYFKRGSQNDILSADDLRSGVFAALDKIGKCKKVLVLPPDITRFYSRAGELTNFVRQYYRERLADILPAIGTHFAMTDAEIS